MYIYEHIPYGYTQTNFKKLKIHQIHCVEFKDRFMILSKNNTFTPLIVQDKSLCPVKI